MTDKGEIEPIRPSIPQSFSISHIASSSMHLQWSPPLYCGGSTLEGYILLFFEPVGCETQSAGEKQKQVSKHCFSVMVHFHEGCICI